MNKKIKLPTLYPLNRDLTKTWFVEYTGSDGLRKKLYGKMNFYSTPIERLFEADKLIKSIDPIKSINLVPAKPKIEGNQLVHDLWQIFELRCEGWKAKSICGYKTHLLAFITWYRENKMPQMNGIQAMHFLKYISYKKTNTTRNNYLASLTSLFSDIKKFYKNRYTDNPFEDVRKVREARRTKEWFRPEQVQQLADVISREDKLLLLGVKFLYYCFDRPAEMRMARIADIIFDTKKLRIESNAAKTSRIRFVPIPDALLNDLHYLKAYPEHYYIFTIDGKPGLKHIGRDTLSKRHKAILTRLRYPVGYVFYSWKNTGAVKMLMNDRMNLRYISKCMGHQSLDMTDFYFQSLGVDEMSDPIIFPQLPHIKFN